jgi:hypothetical protein
VSLASRLRNVSIGAIAPVAFYGAVGIVFLVLLPIVNFAPHLGLTGIMSLISAYGLFKKRSWAKWLIAALFFVATTISLYTVYFVLLSNWLVSLGLLIYAVLTWYFTYYTLATGKF